MNNFIVKNVSTQILGYGKTYKDLGVSEEKKNLLNDVEVSIDISNQGDNHKYKITASKEGYQSAIEMTDLPEKLFLKEVLNDYLETIKN